jgi:hypothetical protein
MASSARRGGGDRVLESRHLVGLFLGVVLLCGVFFTLGYVMGHTQYGGSVHAEAPVRPFAHTPVASSKSAGATVSEAPAPSEWDFYTKKGDSHTDSAGAPKSAEEISQSAPVMSIESPREVVSDSPAEMPVASRVASHVPPPQPTVAAPAPKNRAAAQPSRTPRISILLQVAALRHQTDALAMAGLLQQKHFPSFVSAPAAGDTLYRVQVGPFSDERAADAAKAALDRDGFKAIIKR